MLAIGVNIYYFFTGTDLTVVVSRTLFADTLLVLSMVPVYESIRLREVSERESIPSRIKAGMKPVALYTLLLALATFFLFKLFGDPLVGARISELRELLNAAPELTEEMKAQRIKTAKSIYAPSTHVLVVIMGNLLVGLFSSVLAAVSIRK